MQQSFQLGPHLALPSGSILGVTIIGRIFEVVVLGQVAHAGTLFSMTGGSGSGGIPHPQQYVLVLLMLDQTSLLWVPTSRLCVSTSELTFFKLQIFRVQHWCWLQAVKVDCLFPVTIRTMQNFVDCWAESFYQSKLPFSWLMQFTRASTFNYTSWYMHKYNDRKTRMIVVQTCTLLIHAMPQLIITTCSAQTVHI